VTRVSLLIDANQIYSNTIITDLRHLPPYEIGKRNLSEQCCDIRKNILYLYIICFKSLQHTLPD
jgi:hypothetical protein